MRAWVCGCVLGTMHPDAPDGAWDSDDRRSNQLERRWRHVGQGQPANATSAIDMYRPKRRTNKVDLGCVRACALARTGLAAIRRVLVLIAGCVATRVSIIVKPWSCLLRLMARN